MFRRLALVAVLLVCSRVAFADEPRPQIQLDLGLSVIAAGYEHPVTDHVAVMVGAGIFGTYFLPWFDAGDDTVGAVGDLRVTWFAGDDSRGLYVTPYLRAGAAGESGEQRGLAITTGAFVGYAFRVTSRIDARAGLGAQYIYIDGPRETGASTPFAAIDLAVGYRL